MDKSKMREQFEAAYVEEMVMCCGEDIRQRAMANLAWRQENGDYRDPMVRLAYWAWQASREAVLVELPFLYPFYKQEVTEALHALGLKVAP